MRAVIDTNVLVAEFAIPAEPLRVIAADPKGIHPCANATSCGSGSPSS
jgi:hypothetical protein